LFSNAAAPQDVTALDRNACNCSNAIGSACTSPHRELRTVQIPRDQSIELRFPTSQPSFMAISPINGGMRFVEATTLTPPDYEFCIEVRRTPRGRLRTGIGASGRTTVCSPDGSVPGVAVCPAYSSTQRNCKAAS
jgi:hypothetical protein